MTPYEVGYYCQWMGLDWEISDPYDPGCDESFEFQLGTIGAVFDNNAQEFYNTKWDSKTKII